MAKAYSAMSVEELQQEKESVLKQYKDYQDLHLSLNMARGNPSKAQLDLSMPLLDVLTSESDCILEDGTDARNYGGLPGIPEARKFFAEYMGCKPEECIVLGNASLQFMYGNMVRAMLAGTVDSVRPWCKEEKIKFICPIPGYDRHFSICEFLGIEMINVPLTEWGPDMDKVRELVKDPQVKGMWVVPKFTNPYGSCYSDEAIKQLAALEPAAPDFRIFCDNAYAYHIIYDDVPVLNLLEEAKKCGHGNMVYMFGSTSKISFPGAGVACFAATEENVKFILKQAGIETIGYDKLNQLRHVRYYKTMDGILEAMKERADVLRPKFDAVIDTYNKTLAGLDAGEVVKPLGGYFITFVAKKGCATRIYNLCKEAGLTLTPAGATHPYHKDPDDSYLRIAPSFPTPEDLTKAMNLFCCAAKLASLEKYLEEKAC